MNSKKIIGALSKHILVESDPFVLDIENSKGSIIRDLDGNEYLDCFSQFASQPLGWNHPSISELGVAAHKVANSDMYCLPYAQFVEAFAEITPDFKHYFFISGGALAVENALKAAFDWKTQKLEFSRRPLNVIHLKEAFHGRSGYTLSLTNSTFDDVKTRYFPKFPWTRITNPKCYYPLDDGRVSNLENMSFQEAERALALGNVAAIIVEPIQGEGGDNHFRKEFFVGLRRLADEYECLLIFDEVQTGMGLTGKWWCYEHFGVIPDVLVFGKKSQTCGICSTSRIDEVEDNVFSVSSRINSTWGGNIVDMIRSRIFISTIKEENLVQQASEVGDYFVSKLRSMGLKNARGRGLMIAFDYEQRDDLLKRLKQNGLLTLGCGSKSIRFRPHLTFSQQDVDRAIDKLQQSL